MRQLKLIDPDEEPDATFSPCRRWRFTLTRTWNPNLPTIAFVGLNPSVADEEKLDNTTKKCVRWAKRDGFGKFVMLNLYGIVSTNPAGLKTVEDPVGRDNDFWIRATFRQAKAVVFCWGATLNQFTSDRIAAVEEMALEAGLAPLCPGHTKAGFPLHPCRIANATNLIPYIGK